MKYSIFYFRRTPLQCAAYGGFVNCMSVLLEHKADPNAQDKEVSRAVYSYHIYSKYQGPIIQSVVSLTSSLRVISLTVLADSIHSILKFFDEKMCTAKATHIFQQKISAYLCIT